MLISDERTLMFIEILKSIGRIQYDKEFCEMIGLKFPNLVKIKNQNDSGKINHFTAEQLQKVGEIFGADMNYIHGFTDVPFRKLTSTKTSTSTPKID